MAVEIDPLIPSKEVARRLGMTQAGVNRLVHEEGLPCIRVTPRSMRFDWNAVSAWLKGRNEKPTS